MTITEWQALSSHLWPSEEVFMSTSYPGLNLSNPALISHATKVMLKILQVRLQQYVNRKFPDVQAGFKEKAKEPEIKLPISVGSSKKQESSRKTSISALLTMPKPLTVWITINSGKFWEMWLPDHLTCLLKNLYAGQEATVRTGHGTTDWFRIGKGVRQGCILSSCFFNLYAEYVMRNAGLDEAQAGIKIVGRNGSNFRWHHPYGRKWRGAKNPLDESERGEWKSWLKAQHSENYDHGIWSHHFMANRWGNSGHSGWLYFGGLQNHCRWWLQPWN